MHEVTLPLLAEFIAIMLLPSTLTLKTSTAVMVRFLHLLKKAPSSALVVVRVQQ